MPVDSFMFTSVHNFEEQVGRRTVQKFGQVLLYNFVYNGPQPGYSQWAKTLGSSPPGFPLLYLNNIDRRNLDAYMMEVTISYIGTDQSSVTFTDSAVTVELAFKSFSWSGLAEYGVYGAESFIVPLSLQFTYSTYEATFNYTTYKLQSALFQGMAGQYVGVAFAYLSTSYGQPQNGAGPRIGPPYSAILTLTRHSREQMTPSTGGGAGIWRCSETWSMDFNMGSLGFAHP
jgi:hypothetical protein